MKAEGKRILLLYTGNLLFRKSHQTETKRRDALLRADILIQAYNEMGYDGVNVGEKDLMMGFKLLSDLTRNARFPFISSNLVDKKTKKPVFTPYIIKEMMGLKIGIFGLLDESFNPILQEKDPTLTILEPISISKAMIKSLREYCHIIILLSQLGEFRVKKLAKETPQIDLILGGGGESKKRIIEKVNNVPIYRLEPRGGYLGQIDYYLGEMKKPIRFHISSEWDEMEKKLDSVITRSIQIKSELARLGVKDEVKLKELKFLESKQKELEKALFTLEGKNFYRHRPIPVELSIEEDLKIMKSLMHYHSEASKLYRFKVRTLGQRESPEKGIFYQIPKDSPFVGAISCSRCHEFNYKQWLKTKHSKATETIMNSPKYLQEECLLCHSTGSGKIGEYITIEEVPPYLRGVQCEACHGEGRDHPQKRTFERKITLGICRNCHTKDQSPNFNYLSYLEKIGCRLSK
jgi:hypothetical protein